MAQQRRVLLYGQDRMLVDLRAKVLASSGFVAQATNVSKEAFDSIHNGQFDLLILCQTLSDSDCIAALEATTSQPAMKRLLLTRVNRNLPPSMFDGECNPSEGPECLIRETARLLNAALQFVAKGSRARF